MSPKPHPTAAVSALLQPIRETELAIEQSEKFIAELECRGNSAGTCIVMAGRNVYLTQLHPTHYSQMPVPGRQSLLAAVLAEERQHLIGLRSRLEGLQHALMTAAKACTTTARTA